MISLPNNIFNECFLEEVLSNARSMNNKDFVKYQAEKIKQLLPCIPIDTLAVNALRLKPTKALDCEIVCAVWGSPDSKIKNYAKHLFSDDFTPITFLRRGEAIHIESIRSKDEWREIAVYTKHCLVYDLPNVIAVSFGTPQSKSEFINFGYSAAEYSFPSKEENIEALEYATIPFYLGWLYQRKRIDEEFLSEYLNALKGVSVAQLKVIRTKMKNPTFKPDRIADILHISPATVRGHFLKLAPENKRESGKDMSYIDRISLLNSLFDFLKWT